jgi:hypothetical protein
MTDDERIQMASLYARVLQGTVDGRAFFEALCDTFLYPDLAVPGDPYASHVRIGEANVIRHCQGLLAVAANPKVLRLAPTPDDEEAA